MVTQPFEKGRHGALAYVKSNSNSPSLDKFFLDTIIAMKTFTAVADSEGLQDIVIARSRESGAPATFADNRAGLYQLSRTLGPFLIIEPFVEWRGGYSYEASLKAVDAATGETVFLARRKATDWAGLDQILFHPVFNAFIDWTQGVAPSSHDKSSRP